MDEDIKILPQIVEVAERYLDRYTANPSEANTYDLSWSIVGFITDRIEMDHYANETLANCIIYLISDKSLDGEQRAERVKLVIEMLKTVVESETKYLNERKS